jgi:hypothetical protein
MLSGVIAAEFMLEYEPDLPYSIHIMLDNVNTGRLAAQAEVISQQLRGSVDGSLKIEGGSRRIVSLEAKLNAPQGAYVNPQMLQFLVNYIPQSTQKKRLDEIIASGRQVFFDKFVLEVRNESNNRLKSVFNLKSAEFNLDINPLTIDINVEAGLLSLFRTGYGFIK